MELTRHHMVAMRFVSYHGTRLAMLNYRETLMYDGLALLQLVMNGRVIHLRLTCQARGLGCLMRNL